MAEMLVNLIVQAFARRVRGGWQPWIYENGVGAESARLVRGGGVLLGKVTLSCDQKVEQGRAMQMSADKRFGGRHSQCKGPGAVRLPSDSAGGRVSQVTGSGGFNWIDWLSCLLSRGAAFAHLSGFD